MTNDLFGETIYSYSRKQALEDGVLVDLAQIETIGRAFKFPIACTDTVWNVIEAATKAPHHKDLLGIGHDISTMALFAIRLGKGGDQVNFKVSIASKDYELKLVIGPGDTPDPVMTLMMPNES